MTRRSRKSPTADNGGGRKAVLSDLLYAWVALMQRRAGLVLGLGLLLGAVCVWYTSGHLSVDTNSEDMFSPQLSWRRNGVELDRLFPQQSHELAVVIDADTPERAAAAQRRLVARLQAQPQQFPDVFAPETETYFRQNGLLFLNTDELRKLGDALTAAQPFLGTLNHDPSLHGLFTLLARAASTPAVADFDLAPALRQLGSSIDAASAGRDAPLSWQGLTGTGNSLAGDGRRRFIEINPRLDFDEVLPAAAAVDGVRAAARELQLDAAHGVRVRLTGTVALEHEELLSSASGAGLAFAVGIVLVVILLFVALRSWRLVAAAMLTLIAGLLGTAAFAALAVGHLNLISVAFGVLYIGLGIDYALYLCMQLRERLGADRRLAVALPLAARDIGGFMLVCAMTTSLGFFAFTPTDFTGIAELGLISGGGMFISLLVSLTLLPALIARLLPATVHLPLQAPRSPLLNDLLEVPYRNARGLWATALLAAAVAAVLVPRAHFDYDPLDLRDPRSESVSTFRELMRDPSIPTLSLSVVADDAAAARATQARLAQLPLVRQALSLFDFVPSDQDDKLAIIDDLNFTLGPDLAGDAPQNYSSDDRADLQALADLEAALPAGEVAPWNGLRDSLAHLDAALADPARHAAVLQRLRDNLLGGLPTLLDDLHQALQAHAVGLDDLPAQLQSRWRSADGHYRIDLWPRELLDNNAAMQRFIDQVRAAEPRVAGGPVDWLESGRAVVKAFREAFLYSLIAITLLLLVLLRSLRDMALVLIPLLLAGLYTVGGAVLAGIPFNFANVIALPLVLGVGVDYGVYIVQRARAAAPSGAPVNLLKTGTARAVLFGALITVANFGNLALSSHPGTRSMGLLLTVGLSATVLCALVLLPGLLARWQRR